MRFQKNDVVVGGYSKEQRGTVATCHLLTCGTTLPLVAGVHAGEFWLVYMPSCGWCTQASLWLVYTKLLNYVAGDNECEWPVTEAYP